MQMHDSAAQARARIQQLEAENDSLQTHARDLENQLEQSKQSPPPMNLPIGETPPGQQFGAGMTSLSVNLARKIGLRPTIEAMQVFFLG